jgi:hypothetical protein
MSIHKLRISKEVAAGTEEYVEITPPDGVNFCFISFKGDAAFVVDAAVRLSWKHDHATESEVSVWTEKGSGEMPSITDMFTDADGVRKAALILDNGTAGNIYMSGEALLEFDDGA